MTFFGVNVKAFNNFELKQPVTLPKVKTLAKLHLQSNYIKIKAQIITVLSSTTFEKLYSITNF